MGKEDIKYTVFPTPLGKTGLASLRGKLFKVCLRVSNSNDFALSLKETYGLPASERNDLFTDLIHQFNLYFKGLLKSFSCQIDISRGTKFQQKVWTALRTIPYGEIRTYKWMAQTIENPNAWRAVGNANGKNSLSIIIPCHRVVNANGNLGGYTGGTDIKSFLLRLEKKTYGAI